MKKIELLRVIIKSNKRMNMALKHADRSSGGLVEELRARSRAVQVELFLFVRLTGLQEVILAPRRLVV